MSATSKREASRRCLLKKKAESENIDIEKYAKKTFGVSVAEYVTDEFQAQLKGKPIKQRAAAVFTTAAEEDEPKSAVTAKAGQTVGAFIEAFCGGDVKKLKKLKTEIGKKVLSEEVSFGGNDMYLADILNVNLEEINGKS